MKKFLIIFFLPFYIFSQGTFRVESGTSIVGTNDPIITLYNTNIQNNTGTNNLGSGTIWGLIGTVPQTISGTYISNFYGLILNNPNGFSLQSNTTISNRLDMINGDISTNTNTLEIGNSISNTGTVNWTDGTIIGPLKRWFGQTTNSTQSSGIFPIGNNSTNRYVQINYTEAPTDGGFITVVYKNGIPSMTNTYSGLPLYSSDNQVVQNYEDQGYFEITPFDYNSSLNTKKYTLTMRGNGLTTVNDRNTIRLIKSPGPTHTSWVSCGDHTSVNGSNNNDFTVTSSNVIGFSWFNFGGNDGSPLPVELLYFDGVPYKLYNFLMWSTASEHNSDYFSILRSNDGFEWREIGQKKANGNSNNEINYNYVDPYKNNGLIYYKLAQYDFDGGKKEYGPISLFYKDTDKKIVKYINLMGQEIPETSMGVVIEVYDDGSMIRRFKW